ncbi:hypothetical protein N7453_006668 [Penicillium expansum]|nr:hypothetical protein N7453_006668 [Penicillium expansum]
MMMMGYKITGDDVSSMAQPQKIFQGWSSWKTVASINWILLRRYCFPTSSSHWSSINRLLGSDHLPSLCNLVVIGVFRVLLARVAVGQLSSGEFHKSSVPLGDRIVSLA